MKNADKKNILFISTSANRYRITLFLLVFVSFLFNSCDSDFTKSVVDPVYAIETGTHFNTGATSGEISFNIPGAGHRPFTVIVYPQWMVIPKHEGKLDYDAGKFRFDFKGVENYLSAGTATGYVFVKVEGAGIFRVTVTYGLEPVDNGGGDGQPSLYCSTAEIDFGMQQTAWFVISNFGNVGKNWHIENIPSWLELSSTAGYISANESLEILCNVKRDGLTTGTYSQIIQIESENPQSSHGILVKMEVVELGPPVNSATQKWIQGTVQDAYYCKATDVLYILTKSPNNLLVKTAQTDSLVAYPLDRAPNCIDVTADGKTIAIGYNEAYVDVFDASTLQRTKHYETDCVPFDIVFGENGWCYLAPDEDQWVYFFSLNLASGVTQHISSQWVFYEKSVLRKMPGKPLIYSTCKGLSPSGLQIVNITGGRANDTIPKWHEDTGANIWFNDDGTKIIAGDKEVHNTPDYTTQSLIIDLPETGKFDVPGSFLQSVDHNSKLHCFFAATTESYTEALRSETIYQVDETSYLPEKTVKVTAYPGVISGIAWPAMDVAYVFSNTAGTKLMAVKTVKTDTYLSAWALELFSLPLQ